MNIEQSFRKVSPFAGLYCIADAVKRLNISQLIDNNLPSRSVNAVYKYSDIALSLFSNALLQGQRLSDLSVVKQKVFSGLSFKIPSPDTVEYCCQEIKPFVCNEQIMNHKGKVIDHQHCYSPMLNALLPSVALKTGLLKRGAQGYTLDFDHLVIANEKQDARLSYKMVNGYHPCMAAIGRLPVFIQNHNGNTPARHQQKETLTLCFDALKKEEIEIENFRADSASYQADVIELVESNCKHFYIRMLEFKAVLSDYSQLDESSWKKARIGIETVEVASLFYKPAKCQKQYRLVVTRKLRDDLQLDIETGTAYKYSAIITNDKEQSETEVITFYNQRGDSENTNRYMLNDFNLNSLPFMDMDTNTVYMYMMAYAAILFEWSKSILVKNKVEAVEMTMRVKAVCFHYITVSGEWISKKGKEILKMYSEKKYQVLEI